MQDLFALDQIISFQQNQNVVLLPEKIPVI